MDKEHKNDMKAPGAEQLFKAGEYYHVPAAKKGILKEIGMNVKTMDPKPLAKSEIYPCSGEISLKIDLITFNIKKQPYNYGKLFFPLPYYIVITPPL